MIPILFESAETEFDSNGLGRLRDCIECIVTEERNGIFECDFTYPITGQNYDLIKLGRIVAVEHDDTGDVQPFDIVGCSRGIDGTVDFHCVHISYRLGKHVATGKNINSLAAAFSLFANAQPTMPFSFTTDKSSTGYMSCADGIPRTVREMMGGVEGSVLDAYGGEYKFDRFNVALLEHRGTDRDLIIRYGVDMVDYNEDIDSSETYTSVVPFWNGNEQIVVGNKIASGFASISNRDECVPMDLSEKFENAPTAAQLTTEATSQLGQANPTLPAQTITVDFVRLSDSPEYEQYKGLYECQLCDTIKVVFPKYGMSGRFKIVKTTYDVLMERYTELELGTLSITLSEALGVNGGSAAVSGGGGVGSAVTGVKGSAESSYRTGDVIISPANIGVQAGAEVNQKAFSNVKVGSTTIAADTKTDTLEIEAGSNVTLTPDATNDKVTISATDTTYSDATTSASGLMSATDKSKLDTIEHYGVCDTNPATAAKTVTISGITELYTGLTIAVKFTGTNSIANPTLNVNSLGAKAIKRYGTTAPSTSVAASWCAGSVVTLTYDGQYWQMHDWNNTSYSAMSVSEMQTGTATSSRVITAARLKAAVKYHAPVTSVAGQTGDVTLATVATSGSYNDLTNKPTLFSGDYDDLTNKPTIPVAISDLSNDMVYDLGAITVSGGQFNITTAQRTAIASMWAKGLCAVTATINGDTFYGIKERTINYSSLDFYGFVGASAEINIYGTPVSGTFFIGICTTLDVGLCGDIKNLTSDDVETLINAEFSNFKTISVAGQSNVEAGNASDTLTLSAGSGVSIATNSTTKTITISSTGGGGSGTVDYIVEQGTSGIWTYRKWNSGIAECWGRGSATLSNYATVNGFYGYNTTFSLPSGLFVSGSVPTHTYTASVGTAFAIPASGISTSNTGIHVYALTNVSGSRSCVFDMVVKGRWK